MPFQQGGPGADNRKLFLIIGASSAVALVVVVTLILALSGPTQYSALIRCNSTDVDGLTLEGDGPESFRGQEVDSEFVHVTFAVDCEGQDEEGEVLMSALLIDPLASEESGSAERHLNLFDELSEKDSEAHDISEGDYSLAADLVEDDPQESTGTAGYVEGNLVVVCSAEGDGEPEERIDRALAVCGAYQDAMKADAPRV
ncbi:hypothetical protein [Nocardiopsis coralliicola]